MDLSPAPSPLPLERPRSWVKQEMSKGFSFLAGGGIGHDGQAGWKLREIGGIVLFPPVVANQLNPDTLKTHPIFDYFNDLDILDPSEGSAAAADYR